MCELLLPNSEDTKKIALETYRILDTINRIKEFMFADLEKTLELTNTPKGAPNFMLALVLCCYTEFWGKMKLPQGTNSERFNEFFKALGKRYESLMQQLGDSEIDTQKKHRGKDKIYHDIRCGLAHSYLVDGNARIVIEGGHSGIEYDDREKIYTFYIRRYLEDFKIAVNKFVAEIGLDIKKFNDAEKVIQGEFQLI